MEVKLERLKDKYKKNRRKSAIYNYYSKEINNGRSSKATIFDSVFLRIVIYFVILFLLSSFIDNFIILILFTSILMFFVNRFLKKFKRKKNTEKIKLVKEDLKSKRIRRELSQLNREEFIDFSKNSLEKHYNTELSYGEDGVDLYGTINKKEYAIKCVKSTMEDKILIKKTRDYYDHINNLGFDEGIMVTNGAFQKDEEDSTSLLFIDFLGIKKILNEIDEYPKDEEMDEYILQRYENRKSRLRNDFKSITMAKILRLYFTFIMFYILSYFVTYSLYYRFAGIVVFVIATVLAGIKLTEYVKGHDFT